MAYMMKTEMYAPKDSNNIFNHTKLGTRVDRQRTWNENRRPEGTGIARKPETVKDYTTLTEKTK